MVGTTPNFTMNIPNSGKIAFHTSTAAGDIGLLFTIHPDGSIVRGPAFTTEDEAAQKFWTIITEAFPQFMDKAIAERR